MPETEHLVVERSNDKNNKPKDGSIENTARRPFGPVMRIRIQRICIILPDPDPDQNLAHFHHLSPPTSHLIFHPSSLTPTPPSIISHPLNSSPSYLIRLPSSLNTAHSPLLPHPSPLLPHLSPAHHISPSSLIPHLYSLTLSP